MSLRTVGYIDGKPIRLDEGPSAVNWSGPIRGGMIESQPARHGNALNDISRHEARSDGARMADQRCALTDRCRHGHCTRARAQEAYRLYRIDRSLTLSEIGRRLGGRNHSTVKYWLTLAVVE